MPVSSTPINTLPTQNEPEPTLNMDQKEHENELVSEILNEINQNDTQQTPMKEPPVIQEPEPEPIQNIQSQIEYQSSPDIDQDMDPIRYDMPSEVSMLDRIKEESKRPIMVSSIFILLSLPQVRNLLVKIIPQKDILTNNIQIITTTILGLISGLMYYISNKYLN